MKAKAKLKRVSREREFLAVADLAHTIWREHYAGVISGEQIEYMLEHFQSVPAIKEADARGCEYYPVSYTHLRPASCRCLATGR